MMPAPATNRDWIDIGPPKIEAIQKLVCQQFEVSQFDLQSDRRTAHLVKARHIGMYLTRTLTKRSLLEVGRAFGNRDHTTVLNGVRKIERLRLRDSELNALLNALAGRVVG